MKSSQMSPPAIRGSERTSSRQMPLLLLQKPYSFARTRFSPLKTSPLLQNPPAPSDILISSERLLLRSLHFVRYSYRLSEDLLSSGSLSRGLGRIRGSDTPLPTPSSSLLHGIPCNSTLFSRLGRVRGSGRLVIRPQPFSLLACSPCTSTSTPFYSLQPCI